MACGSSGLAGVGALQESFHHTHMGKAGSKVSSVADEAGATGKANTGSVIDKLTEAQLDEFREAFNSFDKVCAHAERLASFSASDSPSIFLWRNARGGPPPPSFFVALLCRMHCGRTAAAASTRKS